MLMAMMTTTTTMTKTTADDSNKKVVWGVKISQLIQPVGQMSWMTLLLLEIKWTRSKKLVSIKITVKEQWWDNLWCMLENSFPATVTKSVDHISETLKQQVPVWFLFFFFLNCLSWLTMELSLIYDLKNGHLWLFLAFFFFRRYSRTLFGANLQ